MTSRLLHIAGGVLFAAVTGGAGLLILALTVLSPRLGYNTYVVLSGSMEPAIPVGSVVVDASVDPNSLQIGDVITFARPGDQENVTHRIVAIKGNAQGRGFVTQGDANGTDDLGEIQFNHLAGKVMLTIPYLGYIFKFVSSPMMRVLFVGIPGFLLISSWLWELWKPAPKANLQGA